MSENCCKTCQYFRQHYTLNERKIFRIYCGHCTWDRPKIKKPDAAACKNYTCGPKQEDAFVSQEYLSKKLLQHMLSLELLPEIKDSPDTV